MCIFCIYFAILGSRTIISLEFLCRIQANHNMVKQLNPWKYGSKCKPNPFFLFGECFFKASAYFSVYYATNECDWTCMCNLCNHYFCFNVALITLRNNSAARSYHSHHLTFDSFNQTRSHSCTKSDLIWRAADVKKMSMLSNSKIQ